MYRAEVRIELKTGVTDPEGANTKKALELLGFGGVRGVHAVHSYAIDLDAASDGEARKAVEDMCQRLLVNPVIHAYKIQVAKVG
jgi:phosphoribosylformylglycinamidine synthase